MLNPSPDDQMPAHELYARYIGDLPPREFMATYPGKSYREAIHDYWEDCPDWLMDKLVRYFKEQIEEDING
jgi:hypothetical protein